MNDIKQRDLSSGAMWFTGPASFTALAARDRRTLLQRVAELEAQMKVLPDGSRRTYEGMEAECERWKAEFDRIRKDADEVTKILGDRCEMLDGMNKALLEANRHLAGRDAPHCATHKQFEYDCIECADEVQTVVRLKAIVRKGFAVVEDFMPNIGGCVLQDYARLNEFLIEARAVGWTDGE